MPSAKIDVQAPALKVSGEAPELRPKVALDAGLFAGLDAKSSASQGFTIDVPSIVSVEMAKPAVDLQVAAPAVDVKPLEVE